MIRWTDTIGVAGIAFVILSVRLLFPNAEHMNWWYWVVGLALWLAGVIAVVGWLLVRWSIRSSKDAPPPLLVWSLRGSKTTKGLADTNRAAQSR